jgi:hypothetical protein
MTGPIPCIWTGAVYQPLNARFVAKAAEAHGAGEVVTLAPVEDRSAASHRQYFASINEAWQNLPDDLAERYPTADHLRKAALIRAGYRDERTFACNSRKEAIRLAAFLRPIDDYALVTLSGTVVVVYTAKSQSMRAMGKATFEKSKDDVLNALAAMIGVTTSALHQAANDTTAPARAA